MEDYSPYKMRGTDDSRAEGRLKADVSQKISKKKKRKLSEIVSKIKNYKL